MMFQQVNKLELGNKNLNFTWNQKDPEMSQWHSEEREKERSKEEGKSTEKRKERDCRVRKK